MPQRDFNTVHMTTVSNSGALSGPGGRLGRVNVVLKSAAGGLLAIYDDSSVVATSLICTIDLTINASYLFDLVLKRGLFMNLTVAAGDVQVSYA